MPTYVYRCPQCHKNFERFLKVTEHSQPQMCPCGIGVGIQQFTAVRGFVQPNYEPYSSPVTGKMINGRKQHLEDLKRTGCRVFEAGEKEELVRRKAREEVAFEKKIDNIADEFIAGLSGEKVEKLAAEIASGVTATVTRS